MEPIKIIGKNRWYRKIGLFICPKCAQEWKTLVVSVKSGHAKQCVRCARKRIGISTTKHGHARIGNISPEYYSWSAMKIRCLYKSQPGYKNYGGRGISVCEEWLNSFDKFLSDMGRKPTPHHSIDRIDPNGNYTKYNCRWATKSEQMFNQRKRKGTSIYKHVSYDKFGKSNLRWRVKRLVGDKIVDFGRFGTEAKAGARANELFPEAGERDTKPG